jgi:hypothetical protein
VPIGQAARQAAEHYRRQKRTFAETTAASSTVTIGSHDRPRELKSLPRFRASPEQQTTRLRVLQRLLDRGADPSIAARGIRHVGDRGSWWAEWDNEVFIGDEYFPREGRSSRGRGGSPIVTRPEVGEHQSARAGLGGPVPCFLGGEQVAVGLLRFAFPVGGFNDVQVAVSTKFSQQRVWSGRSTEMRSPPGLPS